MRFGIQLPKVATRRNRTDSCIGSVSPRAYLNGGSRVRSLGDLEVRDVGQIPEVAHQVCSESVHGFWKTDKVT